MSPTRSICNILTTLRASSGWNSTFTRTLRDATAVAVDLGNLSVGEYALDLNAVQQGDPWQLSLEGVGHSWSFRDRAGAQIATNEPLER